MASSLKVCQLIGQINVITNRVLKATLRLAPIVPNKVAMAQFPNVGRAVDAVQEILRTPYSANVRSCTPFFRLCFLLISDSECIELLDDNSVYGVGLFHFPLGSGTTVMRAINKAGTTHKPYPARDTLFFKIQGAPEVISKAAEALESIVKKHAGCRFEFASTEEQAKEMWENRKMALFSSLQLEPGLRCWTTDVWFVHVLSLRVVRG